MEISDVEKMKANKDVEGLIEALKDEDSNVRWRTVYALGEIGDGRAAEPIIEALKDKNSDVRWQAAEALEKIKVKKS